MKRVFSVYVTYYASKGDLAGIQFLRDAVRYLDSRNEALNEGKSFSKLISDFAKKVEFDKTTRF